MNMETHFICSLWILFVYSLNYLAASMPQKLLGFSFSFVRIRSKLAVFAFQVDGFFLYLADFCPADHPQAADPAIPEHYPWFIYLLL